MKIIGLAILALTAAVFSTAGEYGAKGLFPAYELDGQWLIFDKTGDKSGAESLRPGQKFLVVGSAGDGIFSVERVTAMTGGACRKGKPARLRASILSGSRASVGDPILAIKVPASFSLSNSHAVFKVLANNVSETLYQSLGTALTDQAIAEVKAGKFLFKPDDEGGQPFRDNPQSDKVLVKIDFASNPKIEGLAKPTALVTATQISNSFARCLRLADGGKLVGDCVEMTSDLMAETAQLRFVSYDPSGGGNPMLLAYSKSTPLWGHERWVFVLRASGPRLLFRDALDPRCRSGF